MDSVDAAIAKLMDYVTHDDMKRAHVFVTDIFNPLKKDTHAQLRALRASLLLLPHDAVTSYIINACVGPSASVGTTTFVHVNPHTWTSECFPVVRFAPLPDRDHPLITAFAHVLYTLRVVSSARSPVELDLCAFSQELPPACDNVVWTHNFTLTGIQHVYILLALLTERAVCIDTALYSAIREHLQQYDTVRPGALRISEE